MEDDTLIDFISKDVDGTGYVKSLVYADKPQTLDHLEDNIRRVIADIRPQMLENSSKIGRPDWTTSEPAVAVICHKSFLKCDKNSVDVRKVQSPVPAIHNKASDESNDKWLHAFSCCKKTSYREKNRKNQGMLQTNSE
ncbi:hypothetical protein TNCV_3132821 [Trichonephila clavipes]|nr:hypothetical protein TNCV_3132821 [Trichonephila clavipes]